MRPSTPLLSRLPVRRTPTTSRQSWTSFVESVTSQTSDLPPSSSITSSTSPQPSSNTSGPNLLEHPHYTPNPSSVRRYSPPTRFSIYKLSEIQRTIDNTADFKLIFYCPVSAVTRVKDAIFDTGAGTLDNGRYTRVAFQSYGTGQYRPEIGANPPEDDGLGLGVTRVNEEVKVEITCKGKSIVRAAVRALLHTHPYDVPVYEVYKTEFGFLPHQVKVEEPTPMDRLSWRPKSHQQEKVTKDVKSKISRQFEVADIISRQKIPTEKEAKAAKETTLEEQERLEGILDFLQESSSPTSPEREKEKESS